MSPRQRLNLRKGGQSHSSPPVEAWFTFKKKVSCRGRVHAVFSQNNGSSLTSTGRILIKRNNYSIPLQLTVSHGEVVFTVHKTILPPVLTSRGRVHIKQTVLPLLLTLLSPAQRSDLHQTKRFSGPSSSNIVSNDSHTPAHLLRSSSHQTEEVKIPSHLSSSYSISGRSKVHIKRNASHTPPYRRDQNDKSTPSTLLSPA